MNWTEYVAEMLVEQNKMLDKRSDDKPRFADIRDCDLDPLPLGQRIIAVSMVALSILAVILMAFWIAGAAIYYLTGLVT